jgi:sulfur-oxidizing protein SoxY
MTLSRRRTLALAAGAAVAAAIPVPALADVEAAVAAFAGGAAVGEGGITLEVPAIAENGAAVPIRIEAPGAVAILVLASGNPAPGVCHIRFGEAAGARRLATRIRLAATQRVIAVARMDDGRVLRTEAEVAVTVGGCVV